MFVECQIIRGVSMLINGVGKTHSVCVNLGEFWSPVDRFLIVFESLWQAKCTL